MKLKRGNGSVIEVEDVFFAKGGQAGIHKIISPSYTNPLAAKLYFDALTNASQNGKSQKVESLKKRLEYMVKNNPFNNSPSHIRDAFIWPVDCLYDLNNNFVGFLMSFVGNSISMGKMINGKISLPQWDKFLISHPDSYNIRLKVCYNIAQALAEMHKTNSYTLVDFKPDNMLLHNNGYVRMIDMDSIQISNNRKIIFNAAVRTPDYSPPEDHLQKVNFLNEFVEQNWDCFSFATLAYFTLLNVHPFMGISHKTDSTITSFEDFLKQGYFANGKRKNELSISNTPHLSFTILLSKNLQNMFIRCFDDGHSNPSKRPTILEWRDALMQEINNNKNKSITAGINQPNPTKKPKVPKIHQPGNYTPAYNVPLPPVSIINSFTLSPAGPNNAMLTWSTTNAVSVSLNNANVAIQGNQIVPIANNTYTIVAFDANGNSVNSTINTVFNLSISKFTHKLIKNALVLDWDVKAASKVSINNKAVGNYGTMQIPLSAGIKTIEAEDSNGFIITSQINVNILTQIEKFNLLLNRTDAFIEWDTINAVNVEINGHKVNESGKIQIPLKTENYKISVYDKHGNYSEKTITTNIVPAIKKFDIAINAYSAEIIWDTWHAKECFINGELVSMSGSKKVPLITKQYTIEIIGNDGTTQQITKSVNGNFVKEISQPETTIKNQITLSNVKTLNTEKIISQTNVRISETKVNITINKGKITLKETGRLNSSKNSQLSEIIKLKSAKPNELKNK